jgi:hypothetical protein
MNLSEMIRYLCVLATPLLSRLTYIFVGNIPLDLNRVLVISKFKKDLNICYIYIHERMVCTAIKSHRTITPPGFNNNKNDLIFN